MKPFDDFIRAEAELKLAALIQNEDCPDPDMTAAERTGFTYVLEGAVPAAIESAKRAYDPSGEQIGCGVFRSPEGFILISSTDGDNCTREGFSPTGEALAAAICRAGAVPIRASVEVARAFMRTDRFREPEHPEAARLIAAARARHQAIRRATAQAPRAAAHAELEAGQRGPAVKALCDFIIERGFASADDAYLAVLEQLQHGV